MRTFWHRLFSRRDRVVFVTTRSRKATREAAARKAATTAALRRAVAQGRAAR